MGTIFIDDVRKSYGRTETIHGVSIDVPDGAFVVLVGPSGCGKSTLLRMIAGLEEIDGGTISIDGQVINDVEPKHRDIAMVFQNYALYPHMTIAENMGFSLRLAGRSKTEIASSVAEAAATLGLSDYLSRFPKELSGGQRQRVAMGRAIVRDPRVFLFDEPLSNLDAKLRVQMRAELRALHRRLGTTTVYVTHDQIEAMTMADRIVVMRDGHVEQSGTPLELYDKPCNRFVASFIGSPSMNFLPGRLEHTASATVFRNEHGVHERITVVPEAAPSGIDSSRTDGIEAVEPGSGLDAGLDVELGVRPEHLCLLAADAKDGFDVRVDLVEPTGAETHIGASLGDTPIVAVLRERVQAQPGDVLRFGVMPGSAHLFETISERAIGLTMPVS